MTKDSLIVISPTQLKQTNLIFSEHEYLLEVNSLLLQELDYTDQLNFNLMQLDSNNTSEIQYLKTVNLDYSKTIEDLQKKVNRKSTSLNWTLGTSSIIMCSLLLFLIIK